MAAINNDIVLQQIKVEIRKTKILHTSMSNNICGFILSVAMLVLSMKIFSIRHTNFGFKLLVHSISVLVFNSNIQLSTLRSPATPLICGL